MNQVKGTKLSKADQAYALAMFVHRYTMDHVPLWVRRADIAYPVQFHSDLDWLDNTLFTVRKSGALDKRHNTCQSSPTWPNRPDLRKDGAA